MCNPLVSVRFNGDWGGVPIFPSDCSNPDAAATRKLRKISLKVTNFRPRSRHNCSLSHKHSGPDYACYCRLSFKDGATYGTGTRLGAVQNKATLYPRLTQLLRPHNGHQQYYAIFFASR